MSISNLFESDSLLHEINSVGSRSHGSVLTRMTRRRDCVGPGLVL
jgi:hypothetical protein